MTVRSPPGPTGVAPPLSSGIKVIVVGLGIGGLSAAIECHRKGHEVLAFDKARVHIDTGGDLLGISTNSARVVSKWGNGAIHDILYNVKNAAPSTVLCDTAGREIIPADMTGYQKSDGYWVLRSMLASTLYGHAESLGIDLRVGSDAEVTDYWETDDGAGVTVNGERFSADCVICCDGINSKGRKIICMEDSTVIPTTEHVFRTSFKTEELEKNPQTKWIIEGTEEGDRGKVFKGRGLEVGFSSFENGQEIVMVIIYNVDIAEKELGRSPQTVNDVVQLMSDWPMQSKLAAVFTYAPQGKIIHHPITSRSDLKSWISRGGRMIVIGDAAHSYLPISGQGGSQAIEDAAVIAITLELSTKANVPLALQIAERIRKPRATTIHAASRVMHDVWYNQDWDAVAKDPTLMKGSRPGWILRHNCQTYTYEEYDNVLQEIQNGQEYIPHNIPADGELGLDDKLTGTGEKLNGTEDKPCYLD